MHRAKISPILAKIQGSASRRALANSSVTGTTGFADPGCGEIRHFLIRKKPAINGLLVSLEGAYNHDSLSANPFSISELNLTFPISSFSWGTFVFLRNTKDEIPITRKIIKISLGNRCFILVFF
jgi:hypothetical protein